MSKRDIYRAVMIAAANGRGLHLSADEVFDLSVDDAIGCRAANSLSEVDFAKIDESLTAWADLSPYKKPSDCANVYADGMA